MLGPKPPRATMADCRAQGWCAKGVRRWLARNGVPMEQFLREGLSIEWLRSRGDAFAEVLADYVETRHGCW